MWVTFGLATIVGIVRTLGLKRNHVSVQDAQNRHLLLQSGGTIPFCFLGPTNSTMLSIAAARALLTSSNGGDFESRHDVGRDFGRNDQRHESEPGGEVGLESLLVAIALIDRFAGDVGYDLIITGFREKLIRCLDQSCHAFQPFAFLAICLYTS